jgi:hypothetical protein
MKPVLCKCAQCGIQSEKSFRSATKICKRCANKNNAIDGSLKRSESLKKYYSENEHPRTGKSHNQETRRKLSLSLSGRIAWNKGKPGLAGVKILFMENTIRKNLKGMGKTMANMERFPPIPKNVGISDQMDRRFVLEVPGN